MKKEKTLSEEIDEICKLYKIPETFWKSISKIEKQTFKEILDEIEFAQQDPYNGFDGQIFELISKIIKQKSGFEELE